MAQVSRKRVEKKVFNRINRRFVKSIVSLTTARGGEAFLSELLASTEQIMLTKRLSIIFMLIENASSYQVHKTLAVSTSTVLRFRKKLRSGELPTIQRYFRRKKERQEFWKEIEVLVRLGMPSYGHGRWKWLYEMDRKYGTHRKI